MSNVVIAQEWQTRPLIEVATLQRGYDLPIQDRTDGLFPIYAANGPLGFHGLAKCKGPGVITGRSGTIGKVHFVEGDYWPLNTSLYVKNFHGNDPRWVYYLLQSFGLERFSQGAGVPTLNRNLVHGEPINVPPLPEQRRIAAILDQADALRAKRREALAQLDEFQRATFIEMFGAPATNPNGYPTVPLGDYVKVLGGYAFKSEDFADTGFPVVRISNLTGDGIDLSNAARMPAEKLGKGAAYMINPGDILMAMSGATTGKIGVAPRSLDEPIYLNQRVGKFRIKDTDKVNKAFLLSFLRSDYYQKYLWGLAAGAAQPNISGGQLESATVALPPIAIQNEFEECIECLGAVGNHMVESEHAMSELFHSLQHRAFRGEL